MLIHITNIICAQEVFKQIPSDERPHGGEVEEAAEAALPVLEVLFGMPAAGPARGSPAWIEKLCGAPDSISYAEMVEFPALLRAYVKQQIALGDPDENNMPVLRPGEYVPDVFHDEYDATLVKPRHVLRQTRRAMGAHKNLQFIRSGGATYAIDKLRDLGVIPMRFKPDTLPDAMRGKNVNNYAKVINYFGVFYNHAQNLSRTSEDARQVVIFLAYGFGVFKEKLQPCIPIIHKKIQTGLHRLTALDKIQKHWTVLIKYVEKHPTSKELFDDKGSADAPAAYLRAVEVGLRTYAMQESAAMGKFAMDSLKEWTSVPRWKKVEAYIAVCRFILDLPEYLKYISYDWEDYISRRHMRATFHARHLQYTDGSKTLEGLRDPPAWGKSTPSRRRRSYSGGRRRKTRVAPPPSKKTLSLSPDSDTQTKRWDSEEEVWVSDAS
jgi:hypothetical protein